MKLLKEKDFQRLNAEIGVYTPPSWEGLLPVLGEALSELNSPRALTVWLLLKSDPAEAARLRWDPLDYNSLEEAQASYAATELIRKFVGLPGTSASLRKVAALEKAEQAERRCCETNSRVLDWTYGSGPSPRVATAISAVRQKIIRTLGRFSIDELAKRCRFGPGSDALNKRPYVSPYHKFASRFSATRDVMPLFASVLEANDLWRTWLSATEYPGAISPLVTLVPGNGALTVPKTALTDRFICVEAGLNVYIQLGIGSMIRHRLKRVGIDLDDQSRNQRYALEGSKTSQWATIDLSSASDTIARRLVAWVFDHPLLAPWLKVMEMSRSLFTRYGKGDVRLNHKFSSMGNGYTFELETLIFWAFCSAVAEDSGGECPTVYGDDIIVSSNCYSQVTEVLVELGFEVNTKKSYNSSYFRESCGYNCWNGVLLSSIRLEKLENLSDVYSFHNGLTRIGCLKAAKRLRTRSVPASLRLFGPSEMGDVVLHSPYVHLWKCQPYGLQDQWFHWGLRILCLRYVPEKTRNVHYEPAILHSFETMRPTSDRGASQLPAARWGSEGFATLTTGVWKVGETLVPWHAAGQGDPLRYLR